jgi:hypothetical protein
MNPVAPSRIPHLVLLPVLLPLLLVAAPTPAAGLAPRALAAQDVPGGAGAGEVRITAEPAELRLRVGESAALRFTARDADGNPVDVPLRVVGPREALRVRGDEVEALQVGSHRVVATAVIPPGSGESPARLEVTVEVDWPELGSLDVAPAEDGTLYAGTTLRFSARALHRDGSLRPDPEVGWRSLTPEVVQVDRFGHVTALTPGNASVEGELDGVTHVWRGEVPMFPAVALEIRGGRDEVRTGDVQRLQAVARDEAGRTLDDLPVTWSLSYREPADLRAPAAPGQVREGRVVADVPGTFTVVASSGPLQARHTFRAEPRGVVQELEVLGQGRQDYLRTTDFWVFEGMDGRDYVITGAKMSDGQAFVFDVTDPARIVKTDSIRVDARSLNDVKVSPDGRYATVTREGASDRRNGLVLLDLSDPAHPVVASEFTERLTGGVHNAYPTDTHVFALSGGERYVILDVEDIYAPRIVSEVQHGDCRIHDVWVQDGIAYSAQWECGVIAYDVGNGAWGGSLENPVYISSYIVPGGATHAVFPYQQESTGRFYLFIGDEIMNRRGMAWEGVPGNYQVPYDPETGEGGTILSTAGYIQVIDFTDPENPEMVARYEVPEYGTHNIWVEDDILYQAYYEGGLRVVDVSGELMGNLYTQGREIAVYRSADPLGYVPNSPMVWSAMPYKGMIFFTDTNSGVWAVRLHPGARPVM